MSLLDLLPRIAVDKPWGRADLPAPFTPAPEGKTGEIWFDPPPLLRELLVKYIFTSENLSVQVHPSDAQTLAKGLGAQGKEECWLVIEAQPGARLGIGLREATDAETLRAAALDGSIEAMMDWHKVRPGDFFYIPAGTIHAIGAGVTVLEIQQNSDITYRLYDYGRPRSLHLDEGTAVALPETYDMAGMHKVLPEAGSLSLVDGPLFRLDLCEGPLLPVTLAAYGSEPKLIIPLNAPLRAGDGMASPGDCALVTDLNALVIAPATRFLIAQPIPSGETL
ncbi:class I mannose-6-phosphate isomerase [Novosphingobium sediminicola]|uniref:Mannose-6-phosphate isomerase n=1 Tax=Novosphingobium sediminicola TaxID=563162 RepID=A0A7W6CLN2_9SPHN|nr:class I mannose-6-phosphate isomerase [Novosphingobium sediminicola]MBB3953752.1 mannose-6-phosphate isomerase [Novosphingobium sediminicola]